MSFPWPQNTLTSLSQRHRFLLLTLIFLGASCLMWELAAKSLWIDELLTLEVVRQPTVTAVIAAVRAGEGRPPLYYLLLHFWCLAAGHSDFALRFLSLLAAILCLPFFYVLARRLTSRQVAIVAVGLLAFAPLYILYSRMARAYFLAVFFALGASYFFARLLDQETRLSWGGYLAFALALLYTDYLTASILLVPNLLLLLYGRRFRRLWPRWLAAQLLLVVGFVPWLPSLLGQSARYQESTTLADLSQGLLGYLVKLAQPILVFSVGETVFPWNPAALAGLPVLLALAAIGAVLSWRRYGPAGLLIILSVSVPVLFTVFVVTGLLVRYMTFAWIGARTLQALPFFILLVAVGLCAIRQPRLRLLLGAVIAAVLIVGDINYYSDREFHNPVYVIPAREIVWQVIAKAEPGDVILAPRDSVFQYYYPPGAAHPVFDSDAPDEAQAYIASNQSPRVWDVSVSRDRGRAMQPSAFSIWLEGLYVPTEHWGYAEQSPDYRRFKEILIQREAYRYKAELTLYVRRP